MCTPTASDSSHATDSITKRSARHWVSIGALTAIALLAFEPFAQAVLAIEDKEVTLDQLEYIKAAKSSNVSLKALGNVPTIGRSTRLDGASWDGASPGVRAVSFPGPDNKTMEFMARRFSIDIQEDMGMKAAIWNGFSPFTAPQNLRPAFYCATGNCTWPIFPSIAVCSKCHDVSKYVTKSTGTVRFPSNIYNFGANGHEWMLKHGKSLPEVSNPTLKDSLLATLACAPDEDLRLRLKQAAVNGKLQEIGGKVKVHWEEDEEFAQLKEKRDDQPSV
ncbi:hypothetical protein BFJ72_g6928 [Fusarium proliferatum]|uniref:Uncharacterized protein n=1 Tax=Gibberella intermedia TaxID=948311 RepID=A0A420TBB2_GIBIN|nr:hypothetical protein BFJ72_g6928 [Fusarium proliferatum]